jgi:hypothetical protein
MSFDFFSKRVWLLYTYDTQTHGRKNPNASSATPQRPFVSTFQPTFHPFAQQNKNLSSLISFYMSQPN